MGCVVSNGQPSKDESHQPAEAPAAALSEQTEGAKAGGQRMTRSHSGSIPLPGRLVAMPSIARGSRRFSSNENGKTRRSSAADRLPSGLFFFGNRNSGRFSIPENSTVDPADKADPLDLGSETQAASAPTQWLVVLGERAAGKSTAIRQLKVMYDTIDANAEATRYCRQVHMYAINIFKQVLREAMPFAIEEHNTIAERVIQLKRRALLTPAVAEDLKVLWTIPCVHTAKNNMSDLQARKAANHFALHLDELASNNYIPEALDLLHVPKPTVGQQDTRISSFPGGEISLIETNAEFRRSAFQGRVSNRQVRCHHICTTYYRMRVCK